MRAPAIMLTRSLNYQIISLLKDGIINIIKVGIGIQPILKAKEEQTNGECDMLLYTLNMIAPTDVLFVNRDELYVPNSTHAHEFYELEYIISGTGVQIVNGKTYEVKRGDLIFIDIKDTHSYYSTNKIEVFNIIIHPTLYELIKKSLSNTFIDQYSKIPTFLRMSTENYIEIEELILKIEYEFLRKRLGYKQVLNNYVIALFIDLYRKSLHDQSTEEDSELKKEIIAYINDNYINLKLADLAAHFGYSPAYFSKYFKRVMDITLSDYLQKKKINCALKLLVDTNLSIEEIMIELGYSDKKNFYQIFKKYTGSTPNQIRKSR